MVGSCVLQSPTPEQNQSVTVIYPSALSVDVIEQRHRGDGVTRTPIAYLCASS